MNIEKSKSDDIGEIMEIIAEAQASLRALEIDQWQDGYPSANVILEDIAAGVGYVVRDEDGTVIATAHVSFDGEPTYEQICGGVWLTDGQYAVIHRIAVANRAKRSGAAAFVISAAREWCSELGTRSIRIDTHEGNLPMQGVLMKYGFTECGFIFLANGDRRVAYELAL